MKFSYTINLIHVVLSATQIPRVSPSFCSSRIYQKFNVLWIYKETIPWFNESIIVCIYYFEIKNNNETMNILVSKETFSDINMQ